METYKTKSDKRRHILAQVVVTLMVVFVLWAVVGHIHLAVKIGPAITTTTP